MPLSPNTTPDAGIGPVRVEEKIGLIALNQEDQRGRLRKSESQRF